VDSVVEVGTEVDGEDFLEEVLVSFAKVLPMDGQDHVVDGFGDIFSLVYRWTRRFRWKRWWTGRVLWRFQPGST
jgi:hypothetical protein